MNLKAEIKEKLEKIQSYFAADESTEVTAKATTTEETTETVAKFDEVTLMDGETVLSYDGDLAVGTAIFVILEDEQVPAPEGTHELGGDMEGVSITVDADGIILEIVDNRADASGLESLINENKSLKAELTELKTQFASFKDEPSKAEETSKFNRSEKPLTRREKYLQNLRK